MYVLTECDQTLVTTNTLEYIQDNKIFKLLRDEECNGIQFL